MARRDLVTGLVLAALGIGYVLLAARLPPSGATRTQLGPHVYPLAIGGFLLFAVALLLITAVVRRQRGRDDVADSAGDDSAGVDSGGDEDGPASGQQATGRTRWGWTAAVLAATCGYLWLLGFLGFVIATTLFLAVCAYLVDGRRRYRGIRTVAVPGAYGLAASVAIYIAFDQLLGVLLPPGLLVPAVLG